MTNYALVIGVSGNIKKSDIPYLKCAKRQAEEVKAVLEKYGNFKVECLTDIRTEPSRIEESIIRLFTSKSEDDIVLLYYLGHGLEGVQNIANNVNNLLLTTSANPYFTTKQMSQQILIHHTVLDIKTIINNISDYPGIMSKQNYIILDCCYSGNFTAPDNLALCYVTSTSHDLNGQNAVASYGDNKDFLFTRHFVDILNTSTINLSFNDLYKQINEKVKYEAGKIGIQQEPNFYVPSDFYLAPDLFQSSLNDEVKSKLQEYFYGKIIDCKVPYFFPYAFISTNVDYKTNLNKYPSKLADIHKDINKVANLNCNQINTEIKELLDVFIRFEYLCLIGLNGEDQNHINNYITANSKYTSNIRIYSNAIKANLNNFKKDSEQKAYLYKLYKDYRDRYFKKRSKDGENSTDGNKILNDCINGVWEYAGGRGSNIVSLNLPLIYLTHIQELVDYLYKSAIEILSRSKKDNVVDDRLLDENKKNKLSESEFINKKTLYRDTAKLDFTNEDEVSKEWTEELNIAIDTARKEFDKQSPKPVVEILSREIPINTKASWKDLLLTWAIVIGAGFIVFMLIFTLSKKAEQDLQVKWCPDSDRIKKQGIVSTSKEYSYLNKIIDQNKVANCKDVSNISFVKLDGESIESSSLSILINLFEDLPKLEEIDLRENNIDKLPDLSNLKSLKRLYLSRNKIKNLAKLPANVEVVWLDFNQIDSYSDLSISSNIQELKNIKELKVSNNPLKEPDKTFKTILEDLKSIKKLWMETVGLDKVAVNSSNIESLYLANNKVKSIKTLNIQNIKDLDISENSLFQNIDVSNMPYLETLKLSRNELKSITFCGEINICPNYLKLREIDLSSNEFGDDLIKKFSSCNIASNTIVKDQTTNNCFSQLRTLILDSNKISSIQGIGNLSRLTYLKLSSNNITNIADINKLENLYELILFNNQIKYNNDLIAIFKLLESKSNISVVDLRDNELSLDEIKNWKDLRDEFLNLRNLTKLNLLSKFKYKDPLSLPEGMKDIKDACPGREKCDVEKYGG